MTRREKVIVTAYTGYLMCGMSEVHKYIEEIVGRPVFTHELPEVLVSANVRNRILQDFTAICQADDAPDVVEVEDNKIINATAIFKTPIKQ